MPVEESSLPLGNLEICFTSSRQDFILPCNITIDITASEINNTLNLLWKYNNSNNHNNGYANNNKIPTKSKIILSSRLTFALLFFVNAELNVAENALAFNFMHFQPLLNR